VEPKRCLALNAGCKAVFLISHDDSDPHTLLPIVRRVRGCHHVSFALSDHD